MVAKINVIRATHDRIRPIGRGVVYFATPEGVGWALGMGDYVSEGRGVPIGVMENGDGSLVPIFLDDEFLIGPEGSHMNMSGISGLATKTSLVEFLLKSILEKMIKTDKRRVAAVFFNVKGKDLLYLDKANPQYAEGRPLHQQVPPDVRRAGHRADAVRERPRLRALRPQVRGPHQELPPRR